ncbi:exported protein of unknown function [Nitrosotalea devaniterrae]|uniref:Uncharacterized protein n=1 Tax=Nitrosotalea devaniterrae TaxID=1078905 RepID=A0A128A395_9ARCH|nr:exported protein of unknown function [Candidatus Nitrosotalea devanaterra]
MKFERKPIEIVPTCAMCSRPVKAHDKEQLKFCTEERRRSQEAKKSSENNTT